MGYCRSTPTGNCKRDSRHERPSRNVPHERWLIRFGAVTRMRCHNLEWAVECAKYARDADITYAGDVDANSVRWAEIAIENYGNACTALCCTLRYGCGSVSTRKLARVVAMIAAARVTAVRQELAAKQYMYAGTCEVRAPQYLHCTGSTWCADGPGQVPLTLQCMSDEYECTANTLHCTCPQTPHCTCPQTPQYTCAETPQCTCAETPQCTCAKTPQCTCAETLQCTPETLQCTCRNGEGIALVMPPKPARTQCMGALAATPSAVACAVACQPAAYVAAEQGCWSGHGL